MKEAAVACKKALLELAVQNSKFSKLKVRPEDLDTKDTMVYLKSDPKQAYPFGQFIADEGFSDHDLDITATFFGRPPETTWHRMGKVLDVMNASFCEVAVDPETGGVEVTKFVVVCDPGKVLRMTSFEGQLHQAMFFSFYFMMTGLHGFPRPGGHGSHGLAIYPHAEGALLVELLRSRRSGGLVLAPGGLIWIYLFPLMYLLS
jgi:hypothetical protein